MHSTATIEIINLDSLAERVVRSNAILKPEVLALIDLVRQTRETNQNLKARNRELIIGVRKYAEHYPGCCWWANHDHCTCRFGDLLTEADLEIPITD